MTREDLSISDPTSESPLRLHLAGSVSDPFDTPSNGESLEAIQLHNASGDAFPQPGTAFLGFQLLCVLGQGAFGRVYLATQRELAQRMVVLKITAITCDESQTLAKLQHTNIVPIYSVHRTERLQAVCMPYYGAMTLHDVVRQIGDSQALPASGKAMLSTLQHVEQSTVLSLHSFYSSPAGKNAPVPVDHLIPAANTGRSPILELVGSMSYPDAIVWIVGRVCDGLAHAHERGILHLDLKPANILFTDDGQPMLLDFNLSQDVKRHVSDGVAQIGGTLPYMAPEHLHSMLAKTVCMDHRADIYSIGVILYQLLTGKLPFHAHTSTDISTFETMIWQRRMSVPQPRKHNPNLSPALEAIIRKCLAPQPADRYPSAQALAEDLDRHLNNLPLAHANEPWGAERLRKWVRRHPQLTSGTSVAAISSGIVVFLVLLLVSGAHRLKVLEAQSRAGQFENNLQVIRYVMNAPAFEEEKYREGQQLCHSSLQLFDVLDNPQWYETGTAENLSDQERQRLRREVAEILYLMTRHELRLLDSGVSPDGLDSAAKLLRYNDIAIAGYPASQVPRALLEQRLRLMQLTGLEKAASEVEKQVAAAVPDTPEDLYLLASENLSKGNVGQALKMLHRVVQERPNHFWAWVAMGHCHEAVQDSRQVEACFSTAIALKPDYSWSYFLRGLTRLKSKQYQPAENDFDRVLALEPSSWEARINRALARQGIKDFHGAEADLTVALSLGAPATRCYLMRSRVRQLAGDQPGAKSDREFGLRTKPSKEVGWIARGLAWLPDSPERALADFDQALKLNPISRPALQNKAHVLAEFMGDNQQASEVLGRLLEAYPSFVPALGGRGVVLARLGKREAALRDAKRCLQLDNSPSTRYQVAGIYALTSTQTPGDAEQALRLLASALHSGWGLDLIATDRDFDPIRNHPDFQKLLNATLALKSVQTSRDHGSVRQ